MGDVLMEMPRVMILRVLKWMFQIVVFLTALIFWGPFNYLIYGWARTRCMFLHHFLNWEYANYDHRPDSAYRPLVLANLRFFNKYESPPDRLFYCKRCGVGHNI